MFILNLSFDESSASLKIISIDLLIELISI